jgi:hypothetical protein
LAILNHKAFIDNLKFYIKETLLLLEEEEPKAQTLFRSNLRMATLILLDVKMNIDYLCSHHRNGTPDGHRTPWSLLKLRFHLDDA